MTATMRLASGIWAQARSGGWAQARSGGWATADPHALDGDVILAAQALSVTPPPTGLIIATGNVAHLPLPSRTGVDGNYSLTAPPFHMAWEA